MIVKAKQFISKLKKGILGFFSLWGTCIATQGTYHATSVGDAIDSASTSLLSEISRVYCGSLFFLLLGVNVVVLAFSKNDKVLAVAKRTIIFIIAAYFILKILGKGSGGVIGSTMTDIEGWLN